MNVRASRIIEFCFSFLVSFLVLSLISFLTLRPVLKEVRVEARAEWDGFSRAVKERSELLPGLMEAVKGFESGHTKLIEHLLEARSISMRSSDPAAFIAAVDDIERSLVQIDNLVRTRPALDQYPPFSGYWKKVARLTQRIAYLRSNYNTSVKFHNRLLAPFPQNLLTAAFGFVPLYDYPSPQTIAEIEVR
jgi:LemA protein